MIVYKIGKIKQKMEQQKINLNIQPSLQSHSNIIDISNTYQKALKSLHNISNSNINSKSKLLNGPQFVISYNFQNDPNCQVRTHNLLIGLDQIKENQPKKNTFRKNALFRANNLSNSHSNLRNSRNQSQHARNKLIQVRSNQILSNKHKNEDMTAQSFYSKNDRTKVALQSFTHSNTFWKNDTLKNNEVNKKNHEKYINSNIMKIAHRKSLSKTKQDLNVYTNSIQKISRNKINEMNGIQRQHESLKDKSNYLYELPDQQILQKDKTSRLSKKSNKQDKYNEKLQKILRKVKRQATRQSLKQAYVKKQLNINQRQVMSEYKQLGHLNKQNLEGKQIKNLKYPRQNSFSYKNKISSNQNKYDKYNNQKVESSDNYLNNDKDNPNQDRQFQNEDTIRKINSSFQPQQQNFMQTKLFNTTNKIGKNSNQILNYQKNLIQKQNAQKPKRKYHQLIKNNQVNLNSHKNSVLQQFHRIQSQNQNQIGSSKKPSKLQIPENTLPDRSIDYSINQHLNLRNLKQQNIAEKQQSKSIEYPDNINFNKKKSNKNWQNQKQNILQQESQRVNYHANTAIQNRQQIYPNNDRQRFNSSLYGKTNSENFQDNNMKKKLPTDYKQFLRMLSQQNQRKKSIEDYQKQKQLSLHAAKSSRFKNIEQQNQHIKRILSPIGHSFMYQRRKRLSDERKSKSKRSQQRSQNINGSIIQTESQNSDQQGRKRLKLRNLKNIKNKKHQSDLNAIKRSRSSTQNFKDSLFNKDQQNSLNQKNKRNRVGESNDQQNSSKTKNIMKNKNQYKQNQIKGFQSHQPKAKLNSVQIANNQIDQQFEENNNLKEVNQQKNIKQKNVKNNKKGNEQKMIHKMTGMKIPEKAIERGNLKLNKRNNLNQNDNKNVQNKTSTNKVQPKNNQNDQDSKSLLNKNNNKNQNNVSKIKNIKNDKNKQTNKLGENETKAGNNKIKPVDKRVAKQKQRNFKNWKNSDQIQKQNKQQGSHIKKDKQINNKDWKLAQKNKKQKKLNKNGQIQSNQEQNEQQIGQKSEKKRDKRKQINKRKQVKLVDQNGNEKISGQNSIDEERNYNQQISVQQQSQQKINKQQVGKNTNEIENKKLVPSIHNDVENNADKLKVSNPKNSFQINESDKINVEKSSISNLQNQNIGLGEMERKQTQSNNLSTSNKKSNSVQLAKKQLQKSSSLNKKDMLQKQQLKKQRKKQMIQNVLQNEQMQKNGFMQISQSKFQIYNHQSQKSIQSIQPNHIIKQDLKQLNKRAKIVKFLYQLPQQYQQQIDKFIPNSNSQRLINQNSLTNSCVSYLKNVKSQNLRTALQQLTVLNSLSFNMFEKYTNTKVNLNINSQKYFLHKILQPYQNINHQIGVWIYCIGVWRLITINKNDINLHQIIQNQSESNLKNNLLILILQKAILKALHLYYHNAKIQQIKRQQILRMLTGLKISSLFKTKNNINKIFKQIQYNTKKSHIIRAISTSNSKFSKDTINCIRKIQNTPNGQRVLQIVSSSIDQIQFKPKYFWIKEDKFIQFFSSFTIISKRSTDSYWTNTFIQIQNQNKAVYMIDSNQKHTSGSITIYPLNSKTNQNRQKCTIAFYKQIQPQVLKLVGKAMQRLPQNQFQAHTSKLYFEFNIKGTYYVFLQVQNGLYNVAIQSNTSKTNLEFIEFVKKQTMKNDQCQYVEIDKIFKKKPNINTLQNSNQFKQLLNFMKKTNPKAYQAQ